MKNPPLIQWSERGFSWKPLTTFSPSMTRDAELQLRPHDGHRGQRAMGAVEVQQRVEVDVGDAVGVGRGERPACDDISGAVDAAAGLRVEAGVEALDGDAVGPRLRSGPLLHEVALVPAEQDEALEPLDGVQLHDVPDDRASTDLHEWLGDVDGLLLQAGPPAAAENEDWRLICAQIGGNPSRLRRRPPSHTSRPGGSRRPASSAIRTTAQDCRGPCAATTTCMAPRARCSLGADMFAG